MPFYSFSQNSKQTKYNCGVEVRFENLTIKKRYEIVCMALPEPVKSGSNFNTENFLGQFCWCSVSQESVGSKNSPESENQESVLRFQSQGIRVGKYQRCGRRERNQGRFFLKWVHTQYFIIYCPFHAHFFFYSFFFFLSFLTFSETCSFA